MHWCWQGWQQPKPKKLAAQQQDKSNADHEENCQKNGGAFERLKITFFIIVYKLLLATLACLYL